MLGNYLNERCDLYSKNLGIVCYDMKKLKINEKNKKNLLNDLERSKKKYEKYINENIVFDRTKDGIKQVCDYLKKQRANETASF